MGIENKSAAWKIVHSWWVLLTITIMFNWAAFFYVGYRVKYKKWSLYGILYAIPFILLFTLGEAYDTTAWQYDVITLAMLVGWISSVVHAFKIRKEYLWRLEAIQARMPEEEMRLRGQIQSEYGVRLNRESQDGFKRPAVEDSVVRSRTVDGNGSASETFTRNLSKGDRQRPEETRAAELRGRDSSAYRPRTVEHVGAAETSAGKAASTDNPSSPYLVDINRADEKELAQLPGIGIILAKKAVAERSKTGGFKSYDEFSELLGLKPHIAERVRPLVTVSSVGEFTPNRGGRMVDF
ncbi:ComEA family DNA-binding protein [Bacillus sp. EB01]|uniref:ComEA family DNA-binding protein n=1 Tax=Bacillus sp. EB01 TaxID=1347086 RepID=UPI000694113B|nr:helix-hairpin-helix domain-containing protein [Bacillus sp. EB01]